MAFAVRADHALALSAHALELFPSWYMPCSAGPERVSVLLLDDCKNIEQKWWSEREAERVSVLRKVSTRKLTSQTYQKSARLAKENNTNLHCGFHCKKKILPESYGEAASVLLRSHRTKYRNFSRIGQTVAKESQCCS